MDVAKCQDVRLVGWGWGWWQRPVDAIANPIAADVALVPFALGFGALPLLEAGAINISEFPSLIP